MQKEEKEGTNKNNLAHLHHKYPFVYNISFLTKTKSAPAVTHRPELPFTAVLCQASGLCNKPCSASQSQPGVNAHFHSGVKEAAAAIVFADI